MSALMDFFHGNQCTPVVGDSLPKAPVMQLFDVSDSKVHGANMGPGPPGSCRPQVGPMLATWTLLSGRVFWYLRKAETPAIRGVLCCYMNKLLTNSHAWNKYGRSHQTTFSKYGLFARQRVVRRAWYLSKDNICVYSLKFQRSFLFPLMKLAFGLDNVLVPSQPLLLPHCTPSPQKK